MKASRSYLLDTSTVGYVVSGRSRAARSILKETLEHAPVFVSTITEAEILFGLELKAESARLRRAVEELFGAIEVRVWDSACAEAYGRLRAKLHSAGTPLSAMDLLIAAHALACGAVLVTHDKAFRHVTPLVKVMDWAADVD